MALPFQRLSRWAFILSSNHSVDTVLTLTRFQLNVKYQTSNWRTFTFFIIFSSGFTLPFRSYPIPFPIHDGEMYDKTTNILDQLEKKWKFQKHEKKRESIIGSYPFQQRRKTTHIFMNTEIRSMSYQNITRLGSGTSKYMVFVLFCTLERNLWK